MNIKSNTMTSLQKKKSQGKLKAAVLTAALAFTCTKHCLPVFSCISWYLQQFHNVQQTEAFQHRLL